MRAILRSALAAAALCVGGCDSMPGAFEPDVVLPAEMRVTNAGGRTITTVEAENCTSGYRVKYNTVSIGPGQSWTGRYPEGCLRITIEFNSGGGWATNVTMSADALVSINPS